MITANGKEIEIVPQEGSRHYKIQFKSGGQLPDSLSGLYTSHHMAKRDVNTYLGIDKGKKKSDV